MGVDFYSCKICDGTYCDCGPYGRCKNCLHAMCNSCKDKMVKKYGEDCNDEDWIDECNDGDPGMCDICSPDIVRDNDILWYLIEKSGKTRGEIEKEILEMRRSKK